MRSLSYFILFFILFASSCAQLPVQHTQEIVGTNVITPANTSLMRGDVFHIVGPGESLWRISKMYDVKMEDIMIANKLGPDTKITMGQKLFVPQAAPLRPVIPLYATKRWKYIIIHHSATDDGNAFSLYKVHLRRGFNNGLGYDFLIDNGTSGKADGQIEISPRWIKQQIGAHCKAAGMNEKGIGVCLVGNFSREKVSEKQMESLVYLVGILKKYYNVPWSHILGHGQVPGARTECPGTKFPWVEFLNKLNLEK